MLLTRISRGNSDEYKLGGDEKQVVVNYDGDNLEQDEEKYTCTRQEAEIAVRAWWKPGCELTIDRYGVMYPGHIVSNWSFERGYWHEKITANYCTDLSGYGGVTRTVTDYRFSDTFEPLEAHIMSVLMNGIHDLQKFVDYQTKKIEGHQRHE